jgi:hypothetical protein
VTPVDATEVRTETLAERLYWVERFRDEAERRSPQAWGGSPLDYWQGVLDGLRWAEAHPAE